MSAPVPFIVPAASFTTQALAGSVIQNGGPFNPGDPFDGTWLSFVPDFPGVIGTIFGGYLVNFIFPVWAPPFPLAAVYVVLVATGDRLETQSPTGKLGAVGGPIHVGGQAFVGASYEPLTYTDERDITQGLQLQLGIVAFDGSLTIGPNDIVRAMQLHCYPKGSVPPLRQLQRSDSPS